MSQSVGVVVPAYQPDVPVLMEYVEEIDEQIQPETIRIELDGASTAVRKQLETLPATVQTASRRRGKGAAITAGFEALETDILAFGDADGSTPAAELARIVDVVSEQSFDLAVGSRRHPEATIESSQSPSRQYLGDGFAWVARQLLAVSLRDYQCGAKAVTAESWGQIRQHLTERGFAWDIDLIAVAGALGHSVAEVPIRWHDHPDSTVPPIRTSLQLGRALVRARQKAKRLGSGSGQPGGLSPILDHDERATVEQETATQNDD